MKVWMKHAKADREQEERVTRFKQILIGSEKFNDMGLSTEHAERLMDALTHVDNHDLIERSDNDQLLQMAVTFANQMAPKPSVPRRGAAKVLHTVSKLTQESQGSEDEDLPTEKLSEVQEGDFEGGRARLGNSLVPKARQEGPRNDPLQKASAFSAHKLYPQG